MSSAKRPSQLYPRGMKAEILEFLRVRAYRVVAFRPPVTGDTYLTSSFIHYEYRILRQREVWEKYYVASPRLILERL